MAVVKDPDTWDVLTTQAVGFATDLDPTLKDVEIVYKRTAQGWTPWVMVAQSAALRAIGIRQRGLYALQPFRGPRQTRLGSVQGDRIGRYGGTILGAFASTETPDAKAQIEKWAREGRTSMLAFRVGNVPGEGVSVIDGHGSGPPFLWRANDARSTPRPVNVRFNANGYGVATRNTPAADLNAASLAAIAGSELLASYEEGGAGYWALHKTLGEQTNPITFERSGGALPLLSLRILR